MNFLNVTINGFVQLSCFFYSKQYFWGLEAETFSFSSFCNYFFALSRRTCLYLHSCNPDPHFNLHVLVTGKLDELPGSVIMVLGSPSVSDATLGEKLSPIGTQQKKTTFCAPNAEHTPHKTAALHIYKRTFSTYRVQKDEDEKCTGRPLSHCSPLAPTDLPCTAMCAARQLPRHARMAPPPSHCSPQHFLPMQAEAMAAPGEEEMECGPSLSVSL